VAVVGVMHFLAGKKGDVFGAVESHTIHMSDTKDLRDAIWGTKVTCLWDLDQLIGEQGWDDRNFRVTVGGQEVIVPGKSLKRTLTKMGHSDFDPVEAAMSEQIAILR
jgi:hypothetical protein